AAISTGIGSQVQKPLALVVVGGILLAPNLILVVLPVLKFPGIEFNFSQYIEDNVQEAASGVKGENSVKIYGNDLAEITKTANAVKAALASV
ncbi:hypothetical protein OFN63_31360, partial [Escherichia coli]|nr:hypothetical protein [Escherichia coli]